MEVQAVEKGDIRFFELAYLECKVETAAQRAVTVELTDFAMSDADAIDPEVRAKITKWSDFVDYWAVDFDFQNDTFINGWVAYRTRKERRLALRSDAHTICQRPAPTGSQSRSSTSSATTRPASSPSRCR